MGRGVVTVGDLVAWLRQFPDDSAVDPAMHCVRIPDGRGLGGGRLVWNYRMGENGVEFWKPPPEHDQLCETSLGGKCDCRLSKGA
jgi:hypothetical protein